MMRVYLALILLIAFTTSSTAVWAQAVVLQDSNGERLQLNKPAQRIIGLSPHIVENLFAAGAGDRLVGAVAYADYPEQAQSLPQVGAFDTFNLELIVSLKPDLVIAWGSGNGPRIVQQLRALGIAVYVDEPSSLVEIADSIETFGKLAGVEETAAAAATHFRQRIATLKTAGEGQKISVFYQIWNQPLQTINGRHLISDVIRLCGGENVFADAVSPAPKINIEEVLAKDPMLIVASGTSATPPPWLAEWKKWSSLQAVQHELIFHIPPDVLQRHTARILGGARLMCEYVGEARRAYR